jgi:hypothetical protein
LGHYRFELEPPKAALGGSRALSKEVEFCRLEHGAPLERLPQRLDFDVSQAVLWELLDSANGSNGGQPPSNDADSGRSTCRGSEA